MRNCVLILENLRSVENVGSIFRTAEGMGVEKIILSGTTPAPLDRFGRKRQDFAKVALGAEDALEWEEERSLKSRIHNLKSSGYTIVALEQDSRSVRLRDYKAPDKFALIVGSEVDGVSKEAMSLSDAIVEIPMMGHKESLNVSVATGVALFHLLAKK